MQPAADDMAEARAKADLRAPLVPVYANVTAAPVADPDEIRRLLVAQVTGMVRWRESVAAMAEAGVTHVIELGGKVLGAMVKRIAPDARVTSAVSMDDIERTEEHTSELQSTRHNSYAHYCLKKTKLRHTTTKTLK